MKTILLTGITGFFGRAFTRLSLENPDVKIKGLSRDEHKQGSIPPHPRLDLYLGDVRDYQRVLLAMRGADVVVHAAALKVVPKGETDPMEFVNTNITGSMNIVKAALDLGIPKVIGISSDKAVSPENLYGATKMCMEKMFLASNAYQKNGKPVFSIARYGNVMGSTGSVIPVFLEQKKTGTLKITDERMTRYMMTIEQAVELVWMAINDPKPKVYIPRIPSMSILDIAEAVAPDCKTETIGIRPGEKLHESLAPGMTSDNNDRWMKPEELRSWIETQTG